MHTRTHKRTHMHARTGGGGGSDVQLLNEYVSHALSSKGISAGTYKRWDHACRGLLG